MIILKRHISLKVLVGLSIGLCAFAVLAYCMMHCKSTTPTVQFIVPDQHQGYVWIVKVNDRDNRISATMISSCMLQVHVNMDGVAFVDSDSFNVILNRHKNEAKTYSGSILATDTDDETTLSQDALRQLSSSQSVHRFLIGSHADVQDYWENDLAVESERDLQMLLQGPSNPGPEKGSDPIYSDPGP